MPRTHHCAQLTKADLGATVALAGWVDTVRDLGGILFIDLRDREGITQVKVDPQGSSNLGGVAARLQARVGDRGGRQGRTAAARHGEPRARLGRD